MRTFIIWLSLIVFSETAPEPTEKYNVSQNFKNTRRIIGGKRVGETRPYMVYLRPASQAESDKKQSDWMCGGAIIHHRYILTSAACIEDAKNFYVISGTNKWDNGATESDCIKNGAKKAVWKCVPKDYYFDGAEFENIRWMSGDIAVVKVEDDFNFEKRIRGCDYTPKAIAFNNQSVDFEKPETMASIAGWGSSDSFGDVEVARSSNNTKELMETDVQLISKKNCKKRWDDQYHHIIDEKMICTKDDQDGNAMSSACLEQGINCKELEYSDAEYDEPKQEEKSRKAIVPDVRRFKAVSGGFCENDHGGPLIVGHGKTSIIVGVISACMTKDISRKCHGPFLYTSVWTHRHIITCAIAKELGQTCRRSLKTPRSQIYEVSYDWTHHPSTGPAKVT